MAFRSKTRRSGARRKPQDLIWVNKIATIQAVDTAVVGGEILDASLWSPASGFAFERATMMAIKGVLSWTQTGNATSADIPYLAWALYKDATGIVAGFPDPSAASGMTGYDLLWWSHASLASTAAGTNNTIQREAVDIKTKRKLDSGSGIYFVAAIPADTAAPTCNLVLMARFLINRM